MSCERTSQSKIVCSTCCMFFFFYYRKEIQATLERLKRAERNLTEKEQQLREREMKISEREKSLEQQFKVVVSFVDRCLSLWPISTNQTITSHLKSLNKHKKYHKYQQTKQSPLISNH